MQGIHGALGDEVLAQQILAALELAFEVQHRGAVTQYLRLRLVDIRMFAARVQRKHQFALLDELAFADVHLGDRTGRLRMQVDAADGRHAAIGLQQHRHVLAQRRDHAHRGRPLSALAPFAILPTGRFARLMIEIPDAATDTQGRTHKDCQASLFHCSVTLLQRRAAGWM